MIDEKTALTDEKTALEHRQALSDAQRSAYYRADNPEGHYNGAEEEGVQPVDWARWASAIVRRKWLIFAVVAIGTAFSLFAAFRTRDSYQAFAVISVGKEDTALIKANQGDLIVQNDEPLTTKMYLLQSAPLVEEVIVNMNLDQSEEVLNPKEMSVKETFGVIAERAKNAFERERRPPEPAPKLPDSLFESVGRGDPQSPAESWRLAPFVDIFRKNLLVEPILDPRAKNYSAEPISDTRLLRVAYTHHDPALAAAICNQLAQLLITHYTENKSEKFKGASNWLDRSTRELKARAERAEQALANYTRAHNNIAPQGKGSLSADRLMRMQAEVTRAETDRIIKESLYTDVKNGRVDYVPPVYTDANLGELQKKLGDLTVEAAQLGVNYGPDNPKTLEVQQQIATIRKQIESHRKSLETKLKLDFDRSVRDEQAFKRGLEEAKNETAKENVDTFMYGILQQEVDTTKALYNNFLEKSSEANFQLAQQQNNLRVIEPARAPRRPTGPNRTLWMMIGFVFSLTFGVGLALLLEVFDHSIKSADGLSHRLQLPALAIIPTFSRKEARLLLGKPNRKIKLPSLAGMIGGSAVNGPPPPSAENSFTLGNGFSSEPKPNESKPIEPKLISIGGRSPAHEAYRLLRTSIMSSEIGAGVKAKTWLITSSQPAEGKTTTAINVAVSIAHLGRSVLIVDCDLRRPTAHKRLRVDQEPGLSTYLSGQVELENVIQKLDIPGVSLIPSGALPHNPGDMLGSQKMKDMVEELANLCDYIVFDSPPLILADPLILSTIVDSVILVVNGGKSNWETMRLARQELSSVGANVFGVVLNDVPAKHIPYYGYYS
ncbi:MAG: polysaccharide biosynthesis tyrosine autokinase [Chloracidobacterium sp.]|nr:polysaccharide biosynthesis tyrosine autokinase [Chloracidobacterium sp.]